MKYKHMVKCNGKIYPAGTEVPVKGKSANDGADVKNVEKMVARINKLDDTVMQRNSEIQSLKEENDALRKRIVELEATILPEDDSDKKLADEKSDAKPEGKQSKRTKEEK